MAIGWGGFNVVEGVIDHHVLGLHLVRSRFALSTSDLTSGFVFSQSDESCVSKMIVARPLQELELSDQDWLEPPATCHLRLVKPWPHRPLVASGKFTNGQSAVSRRRKRLKSCSRTTGVKPFRVRAV
jgi:hypothetical protein